MLLFPFSSFLIFIVLFYKFFFVPFWFFCFFFYFWAFRRWCCLFVCRLFFFQLVHSIRRFHRLENVFPSLKAWSQTQTCDLIWMNEIALCIIVNYRNFFNSMKNHMKIVYRKEWPHHAVNGLDTFSSHKFSEPKNFQTFRKWAFDVCTSAPSSMCMER